MHLPFSPLHIGKVTIILLALLILATVNQAHAALTDMSRIYRQTPNLADFEVCFGGGCAETRRIDLTDTEWQKIIQLFETNAPTDAVQERTTIAQAIGLLETIIGEKIGTSSDLAGTFYKGSLPGQLDCNDEAINSTTYIRLMRQGGLVQWHIDEDTRTRSYFLMGWPHSTAVIRDTHSGERFAVDSWFYDNGAPATIVPFATWKSGYHPADSPIGKTRKPKKPSRSKDLN